MRKKAVVVAVIAVLGSAGLAGANWFGDAVESAVERTGNRAVDEATDSAYEGAKDAVTHKPAKETRPKESPKKGGAARQSVPSATTQDDEHFVQVDDFFISENPLQGNSWIYVTLAKMVSEPSQDTKKEAEFFRVTDGANQWTKYFWKSRIAQPKELKLGTVVIVFEGRQQDQIYLPPESKEDSRGRSWFMAKVTDLSDSYKGYVTVSGNYKVDLNNLRVLSR